jgi:hypothetical protein
LTAKFGLAAMLGADDEVSNFQDECTNNKLKELIEND